RCSDLTLLAGCLLVLFLVVGSCLVPGDVDFTFRSDRFDFVFWFGLVLGLHRVWRGSCCLVDRLFALSNGGFTVCGVVVGLVWLFENSIVCHVCLFPFI